MAADTVPLAALGGGSSGPDALSGRSPLRGSASTPASSAAQSAPNPTPASPSGPGTSPSGRAGNSTPQPGQSSSDGSGAAAGSAAGGSDPTRSNSSRSSGSGPSADPTGDSRVKRPTVPASPSSQAPAAQTTAQPAAGAANFSATLAQSLAATPADGTPVAGAGSNTESLASGKGEPGGAPGKHSAADDPVSTALTLLENALSGALAGILAAVPTPASPGSAASASGTSSKGGRIGGNGTAGALDTLLGQTLAADPGAVAANSSAATRSPAAASPAATASAGAAALTAAQLASGSGAASPPAKTDPAAMAVRSPVGSSAWTDELGTKVIWMAHQGIESASLQLSPGHLGPLQVTISVHDGQASVWFGAAQPDTRTALQQSLPQLRQLFASQGLTLADAGVSRESPRGQDRQRPGRTVGAVAGVSALDPDTSAGHTARAGGLGLVDTYV